MKLIQEVYVSWGAEVVFITSNFQGNREMMEGCKAVGIPAFVRPHALENLELCLTWIAIGNTMGFLNN
jgi:hypothetical protein